MQIAKKLLFPILLWVFAYTSSGQTTIFSPYSRYGLGELSGNPHSAFMGMGSLGLALGGASNISHSNPASYAWIDSSTFLFEVGITSVGVKFKSNTLSGSANYTNISGFQMAFPITKWWGASIGLLPFSQMGYRLNYSEMIDTIGNIHYTFKGYGGLTKFYFGHAFKPVRNLSVGFNANWLFGNLNKTQLIDFDSASYFDIKHNLSTVVGDFYFDFGLKYHTLLSARDPENKNDDISLDLAFVYGASTNISAREDILTMTVIASPSTGYEYPKDTIQDIQGQKNSLLIPVKLGAGANLNIGDRWIVGAQYTMQNWSEFNYNGITDSLQNSYQYNVGAQFRPDASGKSYFGRIRYRAGFRYNQTYLNLRETALAEYGMSFGLGFPLKNDKTILNVAVELGKRGTIENNLVLENFGKVSFGLTVNERWFIKRKYD